MKISLIGYRGTGKTTIGAKLAEHLQLKFIDADQLLQERAGRKISEIFATDGEAVFRQLEADLIHELTNSPESLVLSTGGGVILRPENRAALQSAGPVVWLKATPRTICTRLRLDSATAHQRPALLAETKPDQTPEQQMLYEVTTLLARREPFYQETASLDVTTDERDEAQIVRETLEKLADLKI
ncbi:Shikimate kinase [Planctopirus ephydatiae]|uniref:Shikimate kinase n=1 Tax=Planctopirus ephydatiae TaxID=2528019 RepID=A0A518GQJ6_9PLAN|nr:shikimate kinase [Planctopirus ephydatiae]QDV30751.1 Shikimate kinase [Planctopirus ephydatiae]